MWDKPEGVKKTEGILFQDIVPSATAQARIPEVPACLLLLLHWGAHSGWLKFCYFCFGRCNIQYHYIPMAISLEKMTWESNFTGKNSCSHWHISLKHKMKNPFHYFKSFHCQLFFGYSLKGKLRWLEKEAACPQLHFYVSLILRVSQLCSWYSILYRCYGSQWATWLHHWYFLFLLYFKCI